MQDQYNIKVTPKANNFFILYLLSVLPNFFWTIFWIVVLIFFVIAAVVGPTVETSYDIINNTGSKNNILIYDLSGAISSGSNPTIGGEGIYIDDVKEDFELIKNDSSIKNIVFNFNSPGGEVYASEVLGDLIDDLLKSKNINQGIFYFDSISASGALLATYKVKNNYVFGSKYGQTGSIGVRLSLPNVEKLADNIGYKEIVVKSGENKDIGSLFRQPTEVELSYFQGQVDRTYDEFITVVANGRNIEKDKVKEIANGFVYFNDEAKEFKLIDEISINVDEAVKKAGSNIDTYNTIRFKQDQSFLRSIGVNTNMSNIFGNQIPSLTSPSLKKGVLYMIDESRID